MQHEIEIKLHVPPEQISLLRKHPLLKKFGLDEPLTQQITNIYYDTPTLELFQQGYSLRTCHTLRQWSQTIKAVQKSIAVLHKRQEWADLIASETPDFSKIRDPKLIRIFDHQPLRATLKPMFQTRVQRTQWHIRLKSGSHIEVALDIGELLVNDQKEPIHELELELKQGKPAHLFKVALALQNSIDLTVEYLNKAERGYRHFQTRDPSPRVIADTIPINPNTRTLKALSNAQKRLLEHIQHTHQTIQGMRNLATSGPGNMLREFQHYSILLQHLDPPCKSYRKSVQRDITTFITLIDKTLSLRYYLRNILDPVIRTSPQERILSKMQQQALLLEQGYLEEIYTLIQTKTGQRLILNLGGMLNKLNTRTASRLKQPKLKTLARKILSRYQKTLYQRRKSQHCTLKFVTKVRTLSQSLLVMQGWVPIHSSHKKCRLPDQNTLNKQYQLLTQLQYLYQAEATSQHLLSLVTRNLLNQEILPRLRERISRKITIRQNKLSWFNNTQTSSLQKTKPHTKAKKTAFDHEFQALEFKQPG